MYGKTAYGKTAILSQNQVESEEIPNIWQIHPKVHNVFETLRERLAELDFSLHRFKAGDVSVKKASPAFSAWITRIP
jgi:hypothetical protein